MNSNSNKVIFDKLFNIAKHFLSVVCLIGGHTQKCSGITHGRTQGTIWNVWYRGQQPRQVPYLL